MGLPGLWFPGLDLPEARGFVSLLPMVAIVVLINGIKNMGDSVVVQRLSRRRFRATDFRLVQGSLNANGLGMLLSGIAASPPTTINSATSGSLVNLTGVASRNVGYVAGFLLVALAFSPKLTAVLLIIPAPVMGAYLLVLMGTYVVESIRTVGQGGIDHQKALIIGLSFSVGIALETSGIIRELPWAEELRFLDNGLTAGTIVAVAMTWFVEITGSRPRRLTVPFRLSSLPNIEGFLRKTAASNGWDEEATNRLCAAGGETLQSLLTETGNGGGEVRRRLTVLARPGSGVLELEFFAVLETLNLQDRLAYISEEETQEENASFRLLRHYAQSVQHQKYNGMDVVKVLVSDTTARPASLS